MIIADGRADEKIVGTNSMIDRRLGYFTFASVSSMISVTAVEVPRAGSIPMRIL
jgi:hypothetical protein